MVSRYVHRTVTLGMMLSLFAWSDIADVARADEAEAIAALPQKSLPAPGRQPLPGRDCLSCPGPQPAAPCFDTHRGFLYYGTCPWDDDPVNGFDDCPRGQCGYPGGALSLAWIRLHQTNGKRAGHHHRSTGGCSTCNAVLHDVHGPQPISVDPQAGETYR